MKQSIIATLFGVALAETGLRTAVDDCVQDCLENRRSSSIRSTTYSSSSSATGASGLQTFLPVNLVGGGQGKLTGVSDLVITSVGGGAGSGAGSGRVTSGTGSNSVLITSANSGASNIVSGKVITTGNFPRADLNAIDASSRNVNSNVVAGGVINNARLNTGGDVVDLDGVFNRLPSLNDLDNLILSSDSVGILKTIQTVATDNGLTCDQKIAYLLQLLGRVKAAVEKKTFAASQLKIIVDGASTEITRLQKLVDANNAQINKLNIGPLKAKLDAFVVDLQKAYADYNRIQSQIPVLEAQVVGSEKEIDVLVRNSDIERNRIQNDRIKINAIVSEIASLQAKIKELQDRQAAIQAGITKGEKVIADNDKAVAALRVKIAGFQDQIRKLTDQADTLSSRVRDLQVKASRVRTDISVADTKKAKLVQANTVLEDRINIERRKNIPVELTRLNDMIDSLKKLVPSVQAEIDRSYYYCFGDGKVEVQNNGGVVVYIVRGEAFGNYLRNLYGRNVVVPAVNGNVLFNGVDIFGSDWAGTFGYPFGSGAFEGSQSLSLAGSFSCLNPGALVTGSGSIVNIGSNWIDADIGGDEGVRRFSLGSCSRLESTRRLPVVGQQFYWSGVPASAGYNLYAGSCF